MKKVSIVDWRISAAVSLSHLWLSKTAEVILENPDIPPVIRLQGQGSPGCAVSTLNAAKRETDLSNKPGIC